MYSLSLVSAPAAEPISTADAKTHVRQTESFHDSYLDGLVLAARTYVEKVLGRALITQTWDLSLDCWPCGRVLEVPLPPLQSVTSITYVDVDGDSNTFSSSSYIVDTGSQPGRVVLQEGYSWPTEALQPGPAITVRFVAGYGASASDIPAPILHAMKLLVGHWYENASEVQDSRRAEIQRMPVAARALLAPYLIRRF